MLFLIIFLGFFKNFENPVYLTTAKDFFKGITYNTNEVKSKWNWNFVGPEGGEVIKIIGNPNVPNWCYGISMMDLWVSYDNGNVWSFDTDFYTKINAFDGGDGIIISDSIAIIATNDTIYRTTDKGNSWVPVIGFDTLLAISSETPDTIIYAADMLYPYFRVWRSNDKGLTWNFQGFITPITVDTCDLSFISHRKDNPNYVRALIEYNDSLVIITGSTDGGISWSIYDTIPGDEARDFQINPYNTNHSFITTTNGLFEATSYTGPWNEVFTASLDTLAQPFDVEFLSSTEIIVSSIYNQGIFKGSQSFTVWDFQRVDDREVCAGIAKSGGSFFCGTLGLGILRSIDGTNWEFVNNGLTANAIFSRGNISSIHDSSFYFTTFGGVLRRTKDYGVNWEILNNVTIFGGSVEYSPYNPNFILFSGMDVVGGDESGPKYNSLYRSLDGGYTWSCVDSTNIFVDIHIPYKDSIVLGITTTMFGDTIAIYRSNKKGEGLSPVFYPSEQLNNNIRGLDSVIMFTGEESLYVSSNYGENWSTEYFKGALSYDRTRRIFYIGSYTDTLLRYNVKLDKLDTIAPNIGLILDHSVSPNGILYVVSYIPGDISAISKSTDSAETFVVDTLPFEGAYTIEAGDSAVFIYQIARGFYVSRDITTGILETKKDIISFNRIVNDFIEIELNLKNYSSISIDIFDITGRKIDEFLKDRNFSPGNHSIKYELKYGKGIYFLRVKTNENTNIYKFIKI